jgi:ubiquinone biosynthesis protein UbiJ
VAKNIVENDREIWVGKNRIYLGDDKVLYLAILGEIDDKIQIAINEACVELMRMVEGKVNTLIDLNNAGKTSKEARKRQKEISESEKTGKVALIGLHPVARVIAAFFMGISENKNVRFFKTRENALIWLKE